LTSGCIRLNHGIDACGLERALGEIGFDLGPALVNRNQIPVIHNSIVRAVRRGRFPLKPTFEEVAEHLRAGQFQRPSAMTRGIETGLPMHV
jgi:hypothetical protein